MSNAQSASARTTPTYTPFTITTFPTIPLTTTFTARDPVCSDIHVDNINILHIDDQTASCLPTGFNPAPTAFFSPGIACPSGYWTACIDSRGVSSITTVTCCPTRGTSISMSCVPDPESLSGPWVNQYCTWTAGNARIPLEVVQIKDGGSSKMVKTLSGVDGINALGVRMVYQATDMTATGTPASTSGPSQTGAAQGGISNLPNAESGPGLSIGATVAIGVIVPVVVIGALVGFFLLWRKRRREAYGATTEAEVHDSQESQESQVENKVYYSGAPHELSVSGQALEMPGTRMVAELSGDARPGMWQHQTYER
ncbi:phosphoinositide 3-kinase regulatory subunit 5 [Podospora aff. communis PSN243]|uniref:Phosphoinositide 3-kinase regulatory subunit 5 n=1 Tax=Podospora aff. communis PSN243 TaxID=3040156 RepID=A0AAV9GVM1_9PEZI|nr:phosphoinositide 3-kinase regulatory subunit 5 [Podospora aff. communis PSN243]